MTSLAERILEEREYAIPAKKTAQQPESTGTIHTATTMLDRVRSEHGDSICLAFSGGSDSLVLLDLAAKAGIRPTLLWVDTQMEYPESRLFVEQTAERYGLELRTARARITPKEQWQRKGWPMLGKMAARRWMQAHPDRGFALNVSECCRTMKIDPARRLTRNLGCTVQLTGQRGLADDSLRGLRDLKDGALFYQQRDRMWIANPLTGWTDPDIARYIQRNALEEHPARSRGAITVGCVFCGGGSQYTNSGYRILRSTWPEAWHRFMVEWQAGAVILALKYDVHIDKALEAIKQLGGLESLAEHNPWLFDYTRIRPRQGYMK